MVTINNMFLGIYSNFPETFDSYFQFISQDLYFLIQVLYWHFVEIVWLYIFLILYSYFYYFYYNYHYV
jgi:heme/copper-type cytochrome/quinol oxidase subunit 3